MTGKPSKITFGEYFRSTRLSRRLGVREYGRLVNKEGGYVSRIESGDISPPNTIAKVKQFIFHLNPTDVEKNFLIVLAFQFHLKRVGEKVKADFAP